MTKSEQFFELIRGAKTPGATLIPITARAEMEPPERYTSPFVRIIFDDGSTASIRLEDA